MKIINKINKFIQLLEKKTKDNSNSQRIRHYGPQDGGDFNKKMGIKMTKR